MDATQLYLRSAVRDPNLPYGIVFEFEEDRGWGKQESKKEDACGLNANRRIYWLMAKPHITRTFAPIHFEDLDPHRFEDLVRQLAYDFKQWQTIESIGRSGADGGFDVRAYEVQHSSNVPDEQDSEEDAPHPMEGNLWMIQCKREKELGPKRVEGIVNDAAIAESVPYGYILVAPAHFSKAAQDKFRDELRNRGVMEFYLWGAGELEDMLYQPKNDHILFAFFGISLASRRRSRTTEIRSAVSIKNKLRRALGDNPRNQSVLIRDLQDANYPYKNEYNDFDKRPRWKGYTVVEFHPLGMIVNVARYFAYFDKRKAEWDFTTSVNNVHPISGHRHIERDVKKEELRNAAKGFWEQIPRAKQVNFVCNGFVRFDQIAFIDDKGDTEYGIPHLFVEFRNERGPFSAFNQFIEINEHYHELLDELSRIRFFPSIFEKPAFGTVFTDKLVTLPDRIRSSLMRNGNGWVTLYDADKRHGFLKPTDVIAVDKTANQGEKNVLLKITNVYVTTGKELLDSYDYDPALKQNIEEQLERQVQTADIVRVIEAVVIYDWQVTQDRPVV